MTKRVFTIFLLVFVVGASLAQKPDFFSTDGVAIKGSDPVAYFSENAAVAGSKQFSYSWQGTEWRFKSQANLDAFKANPEKYAPQYGGYCAYGASEDHLSPTDPAAFTIVNDKLYLNYNPKVKELWSKDIKGRIELANKYWATLNTPPQNDVRAKQFNLEKGLAIQGYDPVAYFTDKKAVKGKKELSYAKDGVTYYFSSASNKDLFVKNSANYEPQYGGWCAYAMGETGEKVEIDPETFKVLDGKLYLFYNSLFNNTLPKWNQNEPNLKTQADKNWKAIYK